MSGSTEPDRDRKAEHIRLALEGRMQSDSAAFDGYAFEHQALPELDLEAVEPKTVFLGKPLAAPLLVSCMTGGTAEAARINRRLATAAETMGIAVGVGSQRRAIEEPSLAATFQVRPYAKTVPVLANLGAVQLNYGYGIEECQQAVDMIGADALVLHLNPLQEAIQPEGQTDFTGLLVKIEKVVQRLGVPVIVKEVGAGVGAAAARRLVDIGVTIIDCAGRGGTNWARIEAARADDLPLGEVFSDWGISTPVSIQQLREIPGLTIIGSGGLRHGLDLAKAIAMGAALGGMAYAFLGPARTSTNHVVKRIERTIRELTIAMFCAGAATIERLGRVPLNPRSP